MNIKFMQLQNHVIINESPLGNISLNTEHIKKK